MSIDLRERKRGASSLCRGCISSRSHRLGVSIPTPMCSMCKYAGDKDVYTYGTGSAHLPRTRTATIQGLLVCRGLDSLIVYCVQYIPYFPLIDTKPSGPEEPRFKGIRSKTRRARAPTPSMSTPSSAGPHQDDSLFSESCFSIPYHPRDLSAAVVQGSRGTSPVTRLSNGRRETRIYREKPACNHIIT